MENGHLRRKKEENLKYWSSEDFTCARPFSPSLPQSLANPFPSPPHSGLQSLNVKKHPTRARNVPSLAPASFRVLGPSLMSDKNSREGRMKNERKPCTKDRFMSSSGELLLTFNDGSRDVCKRYRWKGERGGRVGEMPLGILEVAKYYANLRGAHYDLKGQLLGWQTTMGGGRGGPNRRTGRALMANHKSLLVVCSCSSLLTSDLWYTNTNSYLYDRHQPFKLQ